MRTISKSKKGISPILATLLLIVIAVAAVIVTYAWVMTFSGSTTSQAEVNLKLENIRFYTHGNDENIEIVIRNAGTADTKIVEVYFGESSSGLEKVDQDDIDYEPNTQIVSAGSSLEIDLDEDPGWESGTRYYFKVVTEDGLSFPFTEEA
jgi:flagellin-like protein